MVSNIQCHKQIILNAFNQNLILLTPVRRKLSVHEILWMKTKHLLKKKIIKALWDLWYIYQNVVPKILNIQLIKKLEMLKNLIISDWHKVMNVLKYLNFTKNF